MPMTNLLLGASLVLTMLTLHQLGRRYGRRFLASHPEGMPKGAAQAEAAVLTILGLIMAFAFSGAAQRFEQRRHMITEEANAIGTAYLRIDLLPADAQPALRALFRHYANIRATLYQADGNDGYRKRMAETAELQSRIWSAAVAAGRRDDAAPAANMLLLPALNVMIDITTSRDVSRANHPPMVVFALLAALSLVSAVLVGFNSAQSPRQSWFHTLTFCVVIAITAYVIVDLEYPRIGLIRIEAADAVLIQLKDGMR